MKRQITMNVSETKMRRANYALVEGGVEMGRRLGKAVFTLAVCAAVISPLLAEMTITQSIKLNENADWTSYGTVNLSDGVEVDLNGYDLRVGGLVGSGRIVSTASADDLIVNGSFETIDNQGTDTYGDGSKVNQWEYTAGNAATSGWCKSRDGSWSGGLDAKDGSFSIWFWCQNASRGGASFSQLVNVEQTGWYCLEFWTAARPGLNSYKDMRIHADIDGTSRGYAVCSDASWKKTAIAVMLTRGEHTIAFRSDGTGGGSNPCGLLDNVSLRPYCALRLAHAAGASYSCQSVSLDGVMPIAESLTLDGDCDWRGLGIVYMDDGANLDLAGHNLSADGISYYGADAKDWIDVELVSNGSFETFVGTPTPVNDIYRGRLTEDVHFDSWDWEDTQGTAHLMWVKDNHWCANAEDGNYYVGYWVSSLNKALMKQKVAAPHDGVYRLSYWVSMAYDTASPVIYACIDGTSRGSTGGTLETWHEKTIDMELKAGDHYIEFRAEGSNGNCGLDMISLKLKRIIGFGITNSNDSVTSELRIDVGSGTQTNDIVPIGGNIKFVKDGAGTFVSAMAQTYTGGTVIAAGTAQPKDPATTDSTDTSGRAFKAFGTGSITVSEGAVFDFRANYAYCAYDIQLDGGTLANAKWDMAHDNYPGVGIGALTKDSYMNVLYRTVLGDGSGAVDLGAHRLSVAVPTAILNVLSPAISNGTLAVSGNGWLRFDVACSIDARLEVDCALGLREDIRVRDYVVGDNANAASSGNMNKLEVYGKFIPNTDKFYGCTMLDESTIDLSGRTAALPAESALTSTGLKFPSSITFKDGATVTVHVDGRTDLNELSRTKSDDAYAGYLMKWDTRPDASVKFVLDGDAARKYRLACTDAGLVLRPAYGFMIMFR